jgi:hypothetical protein
VSAIGQTSWVVVMSRHRYGFYGAGCGGETAAFQLPHRPDGASSVTWGTVLAFGAGGRCGVRSAPVSAPGRVPRPHHVAGGVDAYSGHPGGCGGLHYRNFRCGRSPGIGGEASEISLCISGTSPWWGSETASETVGLAFWRHGGADFRKEP